MVWYSDMIFAIPLKLTHLIKDLWCLDGNFRAVREPFIQLLSIHSFIKSGQDEASSSLLCSDDTSEKD